MSDTSGNGRDVTKHAPAFVQRYRRQVSPRTRSCSGRSKRNDPSVTRRAKAFVRRARRGELLFIRQPDLDLMGMLTVMIENRASLRSRKPHAQDASAGTAVAARLGQHAACYALRTFCTGCSPF